MLLRFLQFARHIAAIISVKFTKEELWKNPESFLCHFASRASEIFRTGLHGFPRQELAANTVPK